jgi:hypothetical protein
MTNREQVPGYLRKLAGGHEQIEAGLADVIFRNDNRAVRVAEIQRRKRENIVLRHILEILKKQ